LMRMKFMRRALSDKKPRGGKKKKGKESEKRTKRRKKTKRKGLREKKKAKSPFAFTCGFCDEFTVGHSGHDKGKN